MKKTILFSCIFMAALVACYKDEAILSETPQDPLTKAKGYLSGDERVKMKRHKITVRRAVDIAQEAKGLFADENERMIRTRSIGTTLTPLSITTRSKSRAAGGLDTIMYVVNYSNNEGFVFVSNDDRDGEILMYSGDGNFAMQDTAGNPGLKLHVEMMLAYQEHKLSEIRDAEARGEEYKGNMITEKLTQEMMPNIVTESTSRITSGMPGHICNVTGQPGMPGSATRKDICAPETYVSKDWEGDVNAIDLAQNKYKNQKCFGVPVNPPYINFMTTGNPGFLGPDGEAPPCVSTPYCTPPLWSYKEYYHFYGCKMSMHLRTKRDILGFQIGPLLSTYWDQGAPLMRGNNDAGCAPIAIAQLMAYHNMPKIYGSKAFGGVHRTEIDELRKLKTNIDITNSYYCYAAQNLLQEIRVRLDVEYNDSGSTSTSANFRMKKTRKTLESFGYIIGYNNGAFHHGVWDYYRDYNFSIVRESIINRKPVYIRGNSKSGGNGHQWLLDGYKEIVTRHYFADYYFDEYGKFNAENMYNTKIIQQEYIHANMGWETRREDIWVLRGVYEFEKNIYDNEIYYMAGIYPGF